MTLDIATCRLRVLFHSERIFRSAGGRGCMAHIAFLMAAAKRGMTDNVEMYTREDCIAALQLIEAAAHAEKLHLTRDVRTDWDQL